jgi:four helix bundle protein
MEPMIIKQKHEDLILYAYKCLGQFPKSERHVLAADIRKGLYEIDGLIIRAQKKYHKKTTLQDLDIEVEALKTKIRLAKDLGFLPFKKYENLVKMLFEIGRMVGGWIKSTGA